jgi:choline dehydrogenase-like flavoprotein
MILSAQGLDPSAPLQTDLCIVGAGPAGIAIALHCAAAGLDVLVLESGGMMADAHSQTLCEGEVVDPALHAPATMYRRRGLGGCSTLWGGRCAPLDPIDFAPRPWLNFAGGWPITHAELQPYMAAAADIAELGAPDFNAATALPGGMRPMFHGFAHEAVSTERIERFSRPTNFATTYGTALRSSRRITVLLHATCRQILLAPNGGAVRHLEVAAEDGSRFLVAARGVVLAAGGLEIPRLLLASTAHAAQGVGNAHDQVGRHYMCHLAGTVGVFTPAAGPAPYHGYDRASGGVYCRRRLSIEPWAQQASRIGNAVARLHHPRLADPAHGSGPLSALYLSRALLPGEYTRRLASGANGEAAAGATAHLANLARDPVAATAFVLNMLRRRVLAARKYPSLTVVPRTGRFTLDVHAEQLPNPASRITLAGAQDRFGVRHPRIDWRYTQADIRTVRGTLSLIGSALETGGHGTLAWDPDAVEADILRDGAYGGHHLGTARMSADPRHGVVDAACRVHGIDNLYVAGGAVFATSGQANPTLTILALALRLAAHLRERLREAAGGAVAIHAGNARQAAVLSV